MDQQDRCLAGIETALAADAAGPDGKHEAAEELLAACVAHRAAVLAHYRCKAFSQESQDTRKAMRCAHERLGRAEGAYAEAAGGEPHEPREEK